MRARRHQQLASQYRRREVQPAKVLRRELHASCARNATFAMCCASCSTPRIRAQMAQQTWWLLWILRQQSAVSARPLSIHNQPTAKRPGAPRLLCDRAHHGQACHPATSSACRQRRRQRQAPGRPARLLRLRPLPRVLPSRACAGPRVPSAPAAAGPRNTSSHPKALASGLPRAYTERNTRQPAL